MSRLSQMCSIRRLAAAFCDPGPTQSFEWRYRVGTKMSEQFQQFQSVVVPLARTPATEA